MIGAFSKASQRPHPHRLEGVLRNDSISLVALSIFVPKTTAGHGGNQQSALRRQVPLRTSTFLHPSSKATMEAGCCPAPGGVMHLVYDVDSAPSSLSCGGPAFLPTSVKSTPIPLF